MTIEEMERDFCRYHEYNCIKCPYGEKYSEGKTWCRVADESIIDTKYGKNKNSIHIFNIM